MHSAWTLLTCYALSMEVLMLGVHLTFTNSSLFKVLEDVYEKEILMSK